MLLAEVDRVLRHSRFVVRALRMAGSRVDLRCAEFLFQSTGSDREPIYR